MLFSKQWKQYQQQLSRNSSQDYIKIIKDDLNSL